MAVFDPAEQRMCVRVVYDGVAGAGKTTNLHQLCALFATQRTTELYTPETLDGRTLYFDWVQIAAGVVCGFPLMCQVISVPGQVVLTPRRRHLLASADVVVYVCDSSRSPEAIERARRGLSIVEEIGRERGAPVPLLFQANKQDHLGALSAPDLLDRLGYTEAPSIAAIASEGIGVVDTFVHAVRLVSRAMQARSEEAPFRIDVRRPDQASEVLAVLAETTLDPELAAEMVLEEALSAYLFADLAEKQADPASPSFAQMSTETSRAAPPRLPSPDVPTGFIWPAHTGRATLERLDQAGALRAHEDLRNTEIVLHEAGTHVLRTSRSMRFDDTESARQALVRSARERTQLDELLAAETVLVAQAAADGAWWIWRIVPKMPALGAWLGTLADTEVTTMLRSYGVALAACVTAALRHDLRLDLTAAAFAVQGGRIRYVGDVTSAPRDEHDSLATSVMAAIDSLSIGGAAFDLSVVFEAFERELTRRLGQDEVSRVLHRPEAIA